MKMDARRYLPRRVSVADDESLLPKVILFDMDDTIFDHSLTCRRALGRLRVTEAMLRLRSLDEVWHEYSRLLEDVQPYVLSGRITIQEARVERFRQLARFCLTEVTPLEAADLSRQYRAHYQKLRRTVPGVRTLLERLRGRTLVGVVTNNEVEEQERKLDHLKLRRLIDFMVVSQAVGVAKPDPRIFEVALSKARASPREAVMIGDSWRSDVAGARNVGMRAVWFNRFHLVPPDPWRVPELDSFRSPTRAEAVLVGADSEAPFRR